MKLQAFLRFLMEFNMSKPKRVDMAIQTECAPAKEQDANEEVDLSMKFVEDEQCMCYLVYYPKLEIPLKKRIGRQIVSIH